MTNYNLGKIYKIVRKSDNVLIYVGSTCEPMLCKRFDKHKQKAKKYPNRTVYKFILDNGGWENHQTLFIKVYPCDSRDELHSEEARFIRALNPIGNKNIPMRTDKEYYLDNCEMIKLRFKQYYIDNKEKIKQYKQQYNLNNYETIKQFKQEYYLENIEKLKQKITCCCGKIITIANKSHHLKTKKHINSIPVQFKLIEEMHKNRKQYIFPPLPEFKI